MRRYRLIGVLATIKIKDSKESKFEEIAKKLVNAVNNKEEDNIFYRLYKKSSHIYVFMEGYKDKEALTAHTKTTHYKEHGKAMAEFLDGAPEVIVMNELAPNK
jgi:quinol monooxygenase YgiN